MKKYLFFLVAILLISTAIANGQPPPLAGRVLDDAVMEGTCGPPNFISAVFQFNRPLPNGTVSIWWHTVDGSASWKEPDYHRVKRMQEFEKPDNNRPWRGVPLRVRIKRDCKIEPTERFFVHVTKAVWNNEGRIIPIRITPPNSRGTAVIRNDDYRPRAAFRANRTTGVGKLCVRFRNLSKCAKMLVWDFGDGTRRKTPGDVKMVRHCYNDVQKFYTVTLTAYGPLCCGREDTMVKERYIKVHKPAEVAFNATPIAGPPGMEVQFTNNSGGGANHWWWDFGNGHAEVLSHGVMDKVHPVSTYSEAGSYSAGLYGYGNGGGDLFVVPDFIYVHPDFVELALEDGSETYPGNGWDNAIDHDVISPDATATAMNGDAWAVFSFADSTEKMLHKIRITPHTICPVDFSNMKETPPPDDPSSGFLYLIDPTLRLVGSKTNLVKDFQVMVSSDGTTFDEAFSGTVDTKCDFVEFEFDAVAAKYVKLVMLNAWGENSPYISIAELQAFATEMPAPIAGNGAGLNGEGSVGQLPTEYGLSANYPNPFNPETTISYQLPEVSDVMLHVYNVQGQKIATLVNERKDAGSYQVVWNGMNDFGQAVAGGMYIYKIIASNADSDVFTVSRKMTFLK